MAGSGGLAYAIRRLLLGQRANLSASPDILPESSRLAEAPANAAAVEKHLKTVEIGGEDLHSAVCAICMDDFRVGSDSVRIPCKHVFHRTCLERWLPMSGTCPLCRGRFPCRYDSS